MRPYYLRFVMEYFWQIHLRFLDTIYVFLKIYFIVYLHTRYREYTYYISCEKLHSKFTELLPE